MSTGDSLAAKDGEIESNAIGKTILDLSNPSFLGGGLELYQSNDSLIEDDNGKHVSGPMIFTH